MTQKNQALDLAHPENHPRIPGGIKPTTRLKEIAKKAADKEDGATEPR